MRKNYLVAIAFFIFVFAAYAQNEIISINTDKVDYYLSKTDSLSFVEYQNYFDEGIRTNNILKTSRIQLWQ